MTKATKKKSAGSDPAIKRCIDRYHDGFVARHGIKPIINGGKHAALFKSMLATWGEPAVVGVIDEFVAGNDQWAVRCGWTVEALYNVAQRMLTRAQQVDSRQDSNRDAAQRATQRRT